MTNICGICGADQGVWDSLGLGEHKHFPYSQEKAREWYWDELIDAVEDALNFKALLERQLNILDRREK